MLVFIVTSSTHGGIFIRHSKLWIKEAATNRGRLSGGHAGEMGNVRRGRDINTRSVLEIQIVLEYQLEK